MPRDFSSDWEHIRSKGKARYLFIHGVLLWGLPMNIVMNLYLHFRAGYPWTPTLYYTIPILLIMGILWGCLMWFLLERKYQQLNKR